MRMVFQSKAFLGSSRLPTSTFINSHIPVSDRTLKYSIGNKHTNSNLFSQRPVNHNPQQRFTSINSPTQNSRRNSTSTTLSRRKMASTLPPIAESEKISPSIIRILGGNPSKFTLQGTNTYLLGSGPTRLLLDTGEGKRIWIETLTKVLEDEGATIDKCLLTHWHHDHVGGVNQLTKLPGSKMEIYKNKPDLNPDGLLDPQTVHSIENGQRFSLPSEPQFEIEALHCPGHAEDHMAFIITSSPHKEEIGSIFTGDNVLGHGTAVFEDLGKYLDSLASMKDAISKVESVTKKKAYPGHGLVVEDADAKITEYIHHRKLRETEALNVLIYGTTKGSTPDNKTTDPLDRGADADVTETAKEFVPGKEWSSMEMVRVIYAAYPEGLHQPAERGLLQVLDKLKKDGTVQKTQGGKWRAKVDKEGGSSLEKPEGRSSL